MPWNKYKIRRYIDELETHGTIKGNTYMNYLFYQCNDLASLDLTSWDVSNVKHMDYTFAGTSSLEDLNISGWNTKNVRSMSNMFVAAHVKSLNISSWNTKNVKDMSGMFARCVKLTKLNVSKWNTKNARDMSGMFRNCANLKRIYVSNTWTTAAIVQGRGGNMFTGCKKLKGGNGTSYSPKHVDKAYARIDASGRKGYLTAA